MIDEEDLINNAAIFWFWILIFVWTSFVYSSCQFDCFDQRLG